MPLSIDSEKFSKISGEASTILIAPAWQIHPWFPGLLCMSVRTPLLLPETRDLLKDPAGNYHSLIQENSLKLVPWTISEKNYRQWEFQKGFQTLSLQVHLSITNRLVGNGLAVVVDEKCVPLGAI